MVIENRERGEALKDTTTYKNNNDKINYIVQCIFLGLIGASITEWQVYKGVLSTMKGAFHVKSTWYKWKEKSKIE